ncbi:MAG: 30S ribosomal protein S9 [Microgenomates group bacterium GW2011_GWA1_Microgenomates_45_10]|nr:MAG: 30S ribosomal protein S9 [Microgenomates group bacterium GW2011_GWA2_44_7]KKT78096.1 MAG: 30S ribosomal protein S9 [Microgenomates group bacterium GW2011_GWB1_44_8]KKT87433.1 MAG: 30S ribosomal protein S9 [Microgenomates group bacterium GW2011_GWA1_Microgenomates_45_10]
MPKKKTVIKKDEVKIKAVGRRREAIASVTMVPGVGEIIINKISGQVYFPGKMEQMLLKKPFEVTETLNKYSLFIRARGGGKMGQLEAVVLGIARSLVKINQTYKPLLRRADLLTRDPRQRERRKVGTGGKARRQKQSPKR